MSGFPFRDIVLPAVLVSSATFAGLTLPFAFVSSDPVVVELPPFFSGEIQPIFATERKDMAIRYVGFAIVASVGAGMGTVEFIRTRQASQKLTQTQKEVSNLQLSLQGKEVQIETLKHLGDTGHSSPLLEDELPEEESNFPTLSLEQYLAAETPELEPQPLSEFSGMFGDPLALENGTSLALQTVAFQNGDSEGSIAAVWNGTAVTSIPAEASFAEQPLSEPALECCRDYVTCRIRVPQLQGNLFALLHQGQYYSLFRVRDHYDTICAIASRLQQIGKKFVITQTDKGYAVWTWQPDAYPDLAS